jgi:uncharacterized protein (DUF433 family)
MSAQSADQRYTEPLYSVADAARYLVVPASTFRTWVRGYERRPQGRATVTGEPIVTSVAPRGGATIPFIGFAEGYVLAALKKAGVPLQRIRPALDHLQRELGIDHALASKSLYTDGAEVLYDYAESHGDTPEAKSARDLVVVRNNQRVFTDIIDAYLQRIEFAEDERAALIHLPQYSHADVVVDPRRSFGVPIFARGANRLEDVLASFKAGESLESLTDEFGVPRSDLLDVLRVNVAD